MQNQSVFKMLESSGISHLQFRDRIIRRNEASNIIENKFYIFI